jgi:hypothetical protein
MRQRCKHNATAFLNALLASGTKMSLAVGFAVAAVAAVAPLLLDLLRISDLQCLITL